MIENQKVVKASFELYIQGEQEGQEEMIQKATEQNPLVYCQGEGMMLPAFEQALAGKDAGDSFDFVIPCTEAHGEYDERGVKELPIEAFYNGDGEFDKEYVFEGNIIPMRTEDGMTINAEVVSIDEHKVTIDLNHPLAGEDLHFKGTILEVRDATAEELENIRHPHHGCGKCCSQKKKENCGSGCGEGCGEGCGGCK